MSRIMIAGTGSGAGKTTAVIGLMKALVNRGMNVSAFKCGPDYIDPMFHKKVVGTMARNLDSIFCDENRIRYLTSVNEGEISVMEGVMGYYDGVGTAGSSMEISRITKTPVIIVIDCKGMGMSIGAVMKGFLTYRNNHQIVGFIFNRLPDSLEKTVREICDELHTGYFGRIPFKKEVSIESRHLGLITADEMEDLKGKVEKLANLCEEYLDLSAIIKAANKAEPLEYEEPCPEVKPLQNHTRIALADDRAFSFIYQDNIDFLERMGVEVVRFSPLKDEHVPWGINGLILPGGYPELYAEELENNSSMRKSIRQAVLAVPTIAECGGFMYLHDFLRSKGKDYEMAGVIRGTVHNENRLVRFGYVEMECKEENLFGQKGEKIKAHEFHYWDSDNGGSDCNVRKLSRKQEYEHGYLNENLYAGFPHIYFYGNTQSAISFVKKCSGTSCFDSAINNKVTDESKDTDKIEDTDESWDTDESKGTDGSKDIDGIEDIDGKNQ